MSADDVLFSAVILSYNSARYLESCVEALVTCFAGFEGRSEIHVFENGSRDGSAALLRTLTERHPEMLKPHYSAINTGTTVSRNRALAACRGRYVLVLDSDATISFEALAKLRETLDAAPDIGMVVPQLRYPDGRYQLSTDQFPTVTRKLQRFLRLRSLEQAAEAPSAPVDVDYAISACWLLPRAVVESVGPLDENIFYSPEDVDYCVRVWLAGYRIVFEPRAVAIHDAQELSRGAKLGKFTWRHAQGLLYYFRKHRYCFSRAGLKRRFPRRGASG